MTFIVNQTFRATVVKLCEQRQVGLFMDAPAYFRDSVELSESLSFLNGKTDCKFFVSRLYFRTQTENALVLCKVAVIASVNYRYPNLSENSYSFSHIQGGA